VSNKPRGETMSQAKLPAGTEAVLVVDVCHLQKQAAEMKIKRGELVDDIRAKRRYHEQQIAEIDALMAELGIDGKTTRG
jgi:hypothetical protein